MPFDHWHQLCFGQSHMAIIPLLFIFNCLWPVLDFGPVLTDWSLPFHQICNRIVPATDYGPLYGAIVCGANPTGSAEVTVLQTSGLYHLLVVSGAHLTFIQNWCKPFSKHRFGLLVTVLLLAFYVLITNAQPPVVRAFAFWLLSEGFRISRRHCPSSRIQFLTGLVCLTLFPSWSNSLSFWLSWLASLAVQIAHDLFKSNFKRHFLTHTLLLPGLIGLGAGHPLAIITNWLLGPIFGNLLLPISLLVMIFHPVQQFGDFIWSLLLKVLDLFCQFMTRESFMVPQILLIIYVGFVQIFWMESDKWRRRSR